MPWQLYRNYLMEAQQVPAQYNENYRLPELKERQGTMGPGLAASVWKTIARRN